MWRLYLDDAQANWQTPPGPRPDIHRAELYLNANDDSKPEADLA
jgi:hypothetical protein